MAYINVIYYYSIAIFKSCTCFITGVMIDDCLLKINAGNQSCISLFSQSGAAERQQSVGCFNIKSIQM